MGFVKKTAAKKKAAKKKAAKKEAAPPDNGGNRESARCSATRAVIGE